MVITKVRTAIIYFRIPCQMKFSLVEYVTSCCRGGSAGSARYWGSKFSGSIPASQRTVPKKRARLLPTNCKVNAWTTWTNRIMERLMQFAVSLHTLYLYILKYRISTYFVSQASHMADYVSCG